MWRFVWSGSDAILWAWGMGQHGRAHVKATPRARTPLHHFVILWLGPHFGAGINGTIWTPWNSCKNFLALISCNAITTRYITVVSLGGWVWRWPIFQKLRRSKASTKAPRLWGPLRPNLRMSSSIIQHHAATRLAFVEMEDISQHPSAIISNMGNLCPTGLRLKRNWSRLQALTINQDYSN